MGLMSRVFGGAEATRALGHAATGMAEIFAINKTRQMERSFDAQTEALRQHGTEFSHQRRGWFDRFVNGLNRLPRPMLAFGTLGLFVYAMVDPLGFAARMQGLSYVPQPLWWLLGAIVSFYFGAREMHYFRTPEAPVGAAAVPTGHRMSAWQAPADTPGTPEAHALATTGPNPALEVLKRAANAAD